MQALCRAQQEDGKAELLCTVRGILKKIKQSVLVGDRVRVAGIDWEDMRGAPSPYEGSPERSLCSCASAPNPAVPASEAEDAWYAIPFRAWASGWHLSHGPPMLSAHISLQLMAIMKCAATVDEVLPRMTELQDPAVANVDQVLLVFAMERPALDLKGATRQVSSQWHAAQCTRHL